MDVLYRFINKRVTTGMHSFNIVFFCLDNSINILVLALSDFLRAVCDCSTLDAMCDVLVAFLLRKEYWKQRSERKQIEIINASSCFYFGSVVCTCEKKREKCDRVRDLTVAYC